VAYHYAFFYDGGVGKLKYHWKTTILMMGEEEVEYGSGPHHGEEEEIEGDVEADSDDGNKPKETLTLLWMYVTRHEGWKRGGITKFPCPHCNTTYTSSYTHVRIHLCVDSSLCDYAS